MGVLGDMRAIDAAWRLGQTEVDYLPPFSGDASDEMVVRVVLFGGVPLARVQPGRYAGLTVSGIGLLNGVFFTAGTYYEVSTHILGHLQDREFIGVDGTWGP